MYLSIEWRRSGDHRCDRVDPARWLDSAELLQSSLADEGGRFLTSGHVPKPAGPTRNAGMDAGDFRLSYIGERGAREGRVEIHDVIDLVVDATRWHFAWTADDERRT